MDRQSRVQALQRLEEARDSRVISYFLSDRDTFPPGIPGYAAMMASEPQLIFIDLLREIGHVKRLDLVLNTRGGATEAVWPFVTLLRQYCDHLALLVPFRAHSAGTMVCLGADEILMTGFAELSPIDPTTGNQFNPRDPTNPAIQHGISVEDVVAYFNLARDRAHLESEPALLDVFRMLTQNVHPLALGNVQRVYLLIRRLALRLLELHLDETTEAENITKIIDGLSTDFYSHTHAISRSEAQQLMGDWVKVPEPATEDLMVDLLDVYLEQLQLRDKFNLPVVIGDQTLLTQTPVGGIIETTQRSYLYETELVITQRGNNPGMPPGFPQPQSTPLAPGSPRAYDFSVLRTGWIREPAGVVEDQSAV